MTQQEPVDEVTLVDVPAAATWFGVAPATVRKWVSRHGIESRGRDGRRLLYALEDLIDLTEGRGR